MQLHCKTFAALTNYELYAILKARVDIFVVEQKCAYPEIDGLDLQAYHLFLTEGEELKAYLRVFLAPNDKETAIIGRVLSTERRRGYALQMLHAGIQCIQEKFSATRIQIEAQVYARSLYEKVGFRQISAEFLEDGIPHIKMELILANS